MGNEIPAPHSGPLISIHVPKTAGTSFGFFLKREFGDKMLFVIPCVRCNVSLFDEDRNALLDRQKAPCEKHKVSIPDLALFVKTRGIRCVHGHIRPATIYPYFPRAIYAVWLRDPVERVVSGYEFLKRISHWEAFTEEQRNKINLSDLKEHAGTKANEMTRQLSDFPLRRFSFIGIMEDLDRDIERFGRQFKMPVKEFPKCNVNFNKKSVLYSIDPELRNFLQEANDKDYALYDQAKQLRGKENRLAEKGRRWGDGERIIWKTRLQTARRLASRLKQAVRRTLFNKK